MMHRKLDFETRISKFRLLAVGVGDEEAEIRLETRNATCFTKNPLSDGDFSPTLRR